MGVTRMLRLPRLGETMEEARVVEWLKPEGSAYRRGEVLLEVETDKTVVEVPALTDGILLRHLVQPGDMVELDAEIAEIEGEDEAIGSENRGNAAPEASPDAEAIADPVHVVGHFAPPPREPQSRTPASPAARTLARRHGLDLSTLAGSGPKGRVQRPDVEGAVTGQPSGSLYHVATAAGGIAVRRYGSGTKTVVFLHGLFADSLGWRDLPRRIGASGLASVAFDLPGHGATKALPADLDGMTDCLADAMDQLSPAGVFILVGHSFGAVAAAKLAIRFGDRAAGLILSAPAGIGLRLESAFIDAILSAETSDTLRHAFDLLGPENGPVSDAALQGELARLRGARSGHAHVAALLSHNGIQKTDIRPMLDDCVPLPHVLTGLRDRVLDWQDATRLSPRVAVHFCAEAGHLPHLAAAGLMRDLILSAARQVPQRNGSVDHT